MMKNMLVVCLFFIAVQSFSQDTINASAAAKYTGKKVIVCDKVFGGRWLENAPKQPTLINMGEAYPNNPFTFVIFGEDRKNFSYKPEETLIGKQVCVTGEITDYNGKPQIIVKDSTQLMIKKP